MHYKNWSINDINYGKPNGDKVDCVDLSIKQLSNDAQQSLINCIDYYLPKRDIQKDNILSKEEQITIDRVSQILKSTTSNSIYTSTVPDKVNARVRGCTDPKAENYNSLAQDNDGSCTYKEVIVEEEEIEGCTDSSALNFNPNATSDNGSCKYEGVIESVSKKYYIWSSTANIKWKLNGQIQTPVTGKMYDSFNIKHDVGSIKWTNDVREVPKPNMVKETIKYYIKNINDYPLITKPYPEYSDIANYYGQNQLGTDSYNDNYGAGKTVPNPWYDTTKRVPLSVSYKDAIGNTKTSSLLLPGDSTTICAQRGTVGQGPGLLITRQGMCTPAFKPTRRTRSLPIPPRPLPMPPKPIPVEKIPLEPKTPYEPVEVPYEPIPVIVISANMGDGSGQSGGSTTGGGQTSGQMDDMLEDTSAQDWLNGGGGSVLGGGDIPIRKNRPPQER